MTEIIDWIDQTPENGENQKTNIRKTAKRWVAKTLTSSESNTSKKSKNQNDVIEKDRENILDKDSAAIVKKEKWNLYTIFGDLKSSDFYSIFNEKRKKDIQQRKAKQKFCKECILYDDSIFWFDNLNHNDLLRCKLGSGCLQPATASR